MATDSATESPSSEVGPLKEYWGWPLYGAGVQSLGRHGNPVLQKPPVVRENELLVRIDAVSLCYTDLKEIDQGSNHPRLTGRNLEENPIIPGHEVSMTVTRVGRALQSQYRIGDRFTLQPDIWVNGKSIPFSFGMDGGYRQYAVIGEEILHGDAGNYLIPILNEMSHAAGAITEPWACVEASYRTTYRTAPKPGGRLLMLGNPSSRSGYQLEGLWSADAPPARVYSSGLPADLHQNLARLCSAAGIRLTEVAEELAGAPEDSFDDMVLLDPRQLVLQQIDRFLAPGGVMAILCEQPARGDIEIDMGRLHYDHILYTGASGLDLAEAYQKTPVRVDLRPGGTTWILGAGGPMGRMHLQRALESSSGPSRIVATEVTPDRLHALEFFAPLASQRRKELHLLDPVGSPDVFTSSMERVLAEGGVDDVEVMVAHPAALAQALPYVAEGGVINLFAGLKRGVRASVDPWLICGPRQVRFIGHSGSGLDDQRAVMQRVISGQLKPELSVAAIGGLKQVPDGVRAMKECTYPGKIIIYPHVFDFPLTGLDQMKAVAPQVGAILERDGYWSLEAERTFLSTYNGKHYG